MERGFINRLDREELSSELEFRGLSNVESFTVDQLRKKLRQCLKLEDQGVHFDSKKLRSDSEEIEKCNEKFELLKKEVSDSKGSKLHSVYRKVEAKLSLVAIRLSRLRVAPDNPLHGDFSKLSAGVQEVLKTVKRAPPKPQVSEEEEETSQASSDDDKGSSPISESDENVSIDRRTVLDSSFSESDGSTSKRADKKKKKKRSRLLKPKPKDPLLCADSEDDGRRTSSRKELVRRQAVSSWGLKFSGDESAMSVRRFFMEVHDFRKAHRMSKADLLREATFLFQGPALEVFRSGRRTFKTWDELENRLTLAFTDPLYEKRLKREIHDRKQGNDEPVIVYLAKMDNLFNLLSRPLSEEDKLEIVGENILAEYQMALSLHRYRTLRELESLLIKLEKSRALTRISSVKKESVEPSLQYVQRITPKPRLKDAESLHYVSAVESSQSAPSPCPTTGSSSKPRRGRRIRCFGCKEPGVTKPNCPKCSPTSGNAPAERNEPGVSSVKNQKTKKTLEHSA
ncbi:multicellular organismal development [Nesidiocoris tenuis]|uniref:Multicellular organismal development n=1 Tax=Nesidiocoris tenuis TaxID=355587 RepID=A0ABN7AYI5_9HEMI|nr:multicellular organismal development [Nesidiocoris tenuis]BET00272.1 multicellular organismal development [Nesidiocoris tenuis]